MSEDTQKLDGGRSFEERVFARFDAMDVRFDAMDQRFDAVDQRFDALELSVNQRFDVVGRRFDGVDLAIVKLDGRVEKLEMRSYDTKPIWDELLKAITQAKHELSRRLNRIEAVAYENRADIRHLEDRFDKLEEKSST